MAPHRYAQHSKGLVFFYLFERKDFLLVYFFLSLNSSILQLKPNFFNFLLKNFIVPASLGVILGNLIKSFDNCNSLIDSHQSLSKSLIEVLLLVFSSTFLTITAQYNEGPFGFDLLGKLPGTTTEYAGTFP